MSSCKCKQRLYWNTLKILDNLTPEEEFSIGKMQISELVTNRIYDSKSQKVAYLNNIVNSLILSSDKTLRLWRI